MKYIFSVVCFWLLVPGFVFAETVVLVGEGIVVDESQVVEGDYYVSVGPFGNTTMSGTVEGDMYAFGGSVTANGDVMNDLTVVSGVSQLHASVTDDVRLLSGETVVAEHIGGDLFVIGGTLTVLSTATIDGDVFFFGGSAVIDGPVGGSVRGTMERLRVDGSVTGNVDVRTYDTITLGSRASIGGDVKYTSWRPLVRAPEAVIEGDVMEYAFTTPTSEESAQSVLIPLFVLLFAALSMYLVFREHMSKLFTVIDSSYAKSGLIGLGVLILGPIISVLLMVTVLGIIIGVISLATTVIFVSLGFALAGAMFGILLAKTLTKTHQVNLLWITIGTVSLYSLGFIPIIGPIFILSWLAITVGGVAQSIYRRVIS